MPGKVLITGAGGFIGAALWRSLSELAYEVLACTTTDGPAVVSGGRRYVLRLPAEAFTRIAAEERPDWLVHCAGTSSVERSFREPGRDFADNVVATESVLRALAGASPATRVLFLSSGAVYGEPLSLPVDERSPLRPISPYGVHKLMCELLCRQYTDCFGLPSLILRVFSAYGPGLRRQVLWDVYQKSRRPGPVVLFGTGREVRDFIHIDDLATAVHHAMQRGRFDGSVVNVASGQPVTIERLARTMLDALGSRSELRFSNEARRGDPGRWEADVGALRALGMTSGRPIEAGVRSYAAWLSAEPDR